MSAALIKLLIFAIIAIFTWIRKSQEKAARTAREQREQPRGTPTEPPRMSDDIEAQERVRRVQEEIRRKIQQRAAARRDQPQSRDEMPRPREPEAMPPVESPPFAPPALARAMQERQEKIARAEQRQAELQDRERAQRELAVMAAQEKADARGIDAIYALPTAQTSAVSTQWIQSLRDPDAIRQAVLLREILGPPVGLR